MKRPNLTTIEICEECGTLMMWNISQTFSVTMQEGKPLSPSYIRTCQGCGAVEGYEDEGPDNLST